MTLIKSKNHFEKTKLLTFELTGPAGQIQLLVREQPRQFLKFVLKKVQIFSKNDIQYYSAIYDKDTYEGYKWCMICKNWLTDWLTDRS